MLRKDLQAIATNIGTAKNFWEAELLAESATNPGAQYTHAYAQWLTTIGDIHGAIDLAENNGEKAFAQYLRNKNTIQLPAFELPLRKLPDFNYCPRKAASVESPQKIRVLHIITNSLPHTQSGYSLRTQAVLSAQRRAGIDARAVTRLNYPAIVGKLAANRCEIISGVPYYRLVDAQLGASEPERLFAHATAILQLLAQLAQEENWQPDLIQCTTDFRNGLVAQAIAQKLNLPWVYEMRGQLYNTWLSRVPRKYRDAAKNSWYYQTLQAKELQMAQNADAVITLSHLQRNELVQAGIAPEKICVVPNAINSADIGRTHTIAQARTQLGLPLNTTLFGSISAVVGYEGFETALAALKILRERAPLRDFRFVLVGDGNAHTSVQSLAAELDLSEAVIFAGKRDATEAKIWYQALDCFVIPRLETEVTRKVTPIKGLQAAAYGIPIVASNLPALAEITPPNPAGILIEPESGAALADGIEKAISFMQTASDTIQNDASRGKSQSTAESISEIAQSFARTHTWEANAESYLELFATLIKK